MVSDASTTDSVTVVGAGLAGAHTVSALRMAGFSGRVTVLGDEGVPPYDRPPLSKELLSRTEPAWLSEELAVDISILADDVRLHDPATALGRENGGWVVSTAGGDHIRSAVVVVATGARPMCPAGWESALTLHTATDADRLRARLRPGSRLVVIGAGWIGAEVAGVAATAGAEVTVVEAEGTALSRQLTPAVGRCLSGWYASAGVELRTATTVDRIGPEAVETADGELLPADLVLAAVGVRPATDWLGGGSVPLESGHLHTDAWGRVRGPAGTVVPGLWAVGDCATRDHPLFGEVPGGHWSAALHDPEPTARAILGIDPAAIASEHLPGEDAPIGTQTGAKSGRAPAAPAPYVFSQQLGHDLALIGRVPADADVHFRGDPAGNGGWLAFYTDPLGSRSPDDRENASTPANGTPTGHRPIESPAGTPTTVRAVLVVDSHREVGVVRRLMGGPTPFRVDLRAATDPSVRLRDLAAK